MEDSILDLINADMEAAIAAQEAGNFSTAASKARSAWMRISSLPDSELNDERLRWKPEPVAEIVRLLERHASATSAPTSVDTAGVGALIQNVEIEYRRG